jgi:hypothetical protein
VKDPIAADGYMLHYNVNSKFGPYEVTGTGALRKLVRELYAIGELQKIKATSAWAKQVKDSATSPLQFAYKFMTSPVDTASGLPKGLYKAGEAVYTSASTTRDPSQDSRTATLLLQSGKKREYAAQFGVDPYSNQRRAPEGAQLGGLGRRTRQLDRDRRHRADQRRRQHGHLRDQDGRRRRRLSQGRGPSDLRARNDKRLTEMGISAAVIQKYLDHKSFTPRHDTIITEALAGLDGVRGRQTFLEAALKAEDEVDANLYMTMAQILRGYHLGVSKLTEIREMSGLLIAQSQGGTAVIPFPLDYGVWRQAGDRLSDQIKAGYAAQGFNGKFEIWVTGKVSPRAQQGYAAKNITIVEEVGRRIEILD